MILSSRLTWSSAVKEGEHPVHVDVEVGRQSKYDSFSLSSFLPKGDPTHLLLSCQGASTPGDAFPGRRLNGLVGDSQKGECTRLGGMGVSISALGGRTRRDRVEQQTVEKE